jgi:pimeloyl-ACP methyl ester carboxylesterase
MHETRRSATIAGRSMKMSRFASVAAALVTAMATTSLTAPAVSAALAPPGGTPCLESSPAEPTCISGTLDDGTRYEFVVPDKWNGTVLVDLDFATGRINEELTSRMLARGVARGGTTRLVTNWNIPQAIRNQNEALQKFTAAYGEPTWAIASGRSMGGFVSAGVAQVFPDTFDAAVPFCGGLGGAVGQWNQKLDTVFVLKTLLFPDRDLPVVDIPEDVAGAQKAWIDAITAAQQTPQGRARIALAASIGQLPAWGRAPDNTELPMPDDRDLAALQEGMFLALAGGPLPYIGQAMSSRRAITSVVGGNPSWNVGVDYAKQLSQADPAQQRAVRKLYAAAGLDVRTDLGALASAPRISADPDAVARLTEGIVFDGNLQIPVFTVSNIGDQISTVAQQESYERAARDAGQSRMLRQAYVESAGHCTFSPAEPEAALLAMLHRLETGRWGNDTTTSALNKVATSLSPDTPSRFISFRPDQFNRLYLGN